MRMYRDRSRTCYVALVHARASTQPHSQHARHARHTRHWYTHIRRPHAHACLTYAQEEPIDDRVEGAIEQINQRRDLMTEAQVALDGCRHALKKTEVHTNSELARLQVAT